MKTLSFKSTACTVAFLLALNACDSPVSTRPAAAYNPTALTNGLYYHWANGSVVKVWVVPTGAATTADLAGAVARALPVWNAVPQYNEVQLVAAASAAEANIIVYDASVPIPITPSTDCTFDAHGAGGYTYFCPGPTTDIPAGAVAQRLPLSRRAADKRRRSFASTGDA